jgi:hypothetical protein
VAEVVAYCHPTHPFFLYSGVRLLYLLSSAFKLILSDCSYTLHSNTSQQRAGSLSVFKLRLLDVALLEEYVTQEAIGNDD